MKQDHVDLVFSSSICVRCDVTIIQEGKAGSQVLSGKYPDQLGEVPLEETKCHPLMVPRYSKIVRVLGSIAHLITFQRFMGRWPNFESKDEWCVSCEKPPKSPGCMIIGSKFPVGKDEITVNHTSTIEHYQMTLDEEQDEPEQGREPEAVTVAVDLRSDPDTSLGAGCDEREGTHHLYVYNGMNVSSYKQHTTPPTATPPEPDFSSNGDRKG